MKAACEVCGSPLRTPNRVLIDGAVMVVCDNCARLGKRIGPPPVPQRERFNPPQNFLRPLTPRPVQPKPEPEYEVDPDYNLKKIGRAHV